MRGGHKVGADPHPSNSNLDSTRREVGGCRNSSLPASMHGCNRHRVSRLNRRPEKTDPLTLTRDPLTHGDCSANVMGLGGEAPAASKGRSQ